MKKIMKLFVYVAAAAMTLASCQKNEIDGPVKKDVHFTINAGIETKTVISDNGNGTYTPSWKNGDQIGIFFNEQLVKDAPLGATFSNTNPDGEVASFDGTASVTGNGTFYAFYPATAFNKVYDGGEVRLDLKNAQNPTSTSFDPSCDLLIAKPYDYEVADGQTEVVINDLCFARMMSVLKINLNSEYLSNETVKSVSFEAEGVQLTGAMRFNLAESSFKGNLSTTGKTKVTAEYSDDPISVAGEKNAVYFVVAPVTIPAGKTLTFTIETENYDISKVVTTPSEKTFLAGNVNVINLNIVEGDCVAKTEDTSDYSGTYAILAKRSTGAFWYMTNDLGTANTKRFTAEEASENLPEGGVTLGASKLWTVSKSDEGYKVKSVGADKYITYTSGNSANLDDEGILFTITKTNDGYYNLSYAVSDETRYLSLNGTSGSDYFALYKDGQRKDLALIPAVQGEEPATLSATAPSQMPAEGGEGSFAYELKNPKDGISLTATTGADWITGVSVGDGEVTYTVTANESEEARDAVITLTYGDLTEYVTITQAGKPAEGGETTTYYEKVTSEPADWSGKYLIVYEGTPAYLDGSLTPGKSSGQIGSTAGMISTTISNDKIASSEEVDKSIVTIEKSGTGYALKASSGKYMGMSGNDNGMLSSTNASDYVHTISINTDYSVSLLSSDSNTKLAYNKSSSYFRYYKVATINGNPNSYPLPVLYRLVDANEGGSETPEPETKELKSIAVSNAKTNYVVGDEFVKPNVTATYDDNSTKDVTASATFGGYDMSASGTQTVTVSYTEGEKTATTTYKIEVVAQQDLPKGITAIKKAAASTDEADFAVTLTDAVVTYVSGNNAYIEDAEAGILIYKSGHGLQVGDKLNGEVSGKVKLYNNLREVTAIDYSKATKTEGAEVPVTEVTLAQLNAEGAYDKYENMRVKVIDATVSATKQISQGDQTYALYFKGQSLTGFDLYNIIDVIGYPSKFNDAIQFNVWENAVVKGATKTIITGISDVTVKVGETKAINATASSGAKVSYVSANPSVATVGEDGKVTGVAEGNTTITVSVPAHNGYPEAEEVCNVTVTAASQGGEEPEQPAEPVIVLNESFSKSTGTMGWSGNAASGTINYDVTGWVCENAYGAGGSAKFGTGSKKGTATTPAFNIAGDMVLTFKAGAWNGGSEQTTLLLSINNGGTLSVTSVTMQKGNWTEYEVTISGATANSTITFSGKNNSNSRFLLDDVKIVKN